MTGAQMGLLAGWIFVNGNRGQALTDRQRFAVTMACTVVGFLVDVAFAVLPDLFSKAWLWVTP